MNTHGDCFGEKGPNTCFFKISNFLLLTMKCPLHIASYARVSVMEL